jgi:glycosyltransferase involved in cell wall biosynthesis
VKVIWLAHRDVSHPRAGGAERMTFEISRRLVARGHTVSVVSGGFQSGPPRENIEGVDFRRFGRRVLPHLLALKVLARDQPDVVVDDLGHVVPWGTPQFGQVPCVVCFRHLHARTLGGQVPPWAAWALTWVEREYPRLYRSSTWVTESRRAVQDLQGLGIDPAHIVRIPPGIDCGVWTPRPKAPDPIAIYFGGLRRYKRPILAVELAERLRRRGWPLRITFVGEGPEASRVRSRAEALGLRPPEFEMVGRLSTEALTEAVGRAWFNVHCSLAEGWCFSALESAAAGTPTVAFDVPGISECVVNGETGVLVPDGDLEGLCDAAEQVLSTPGGFSVRARRHAEGFPWDTTAAAWERVLQDAASASV